MLTRLDDGLIDHDKVEEAAERLGKQGYLIALGAVAWAICYANKKLTDGVIPDRALVKYGVGQSAADALVAVGLWERVEDGYRIHDFHDWNPSASEVKAKRSRDRERKRRDYGFRAEKVTEKSQEREVESCGTANTGRDSLSSGNRSEGEPEREAPPRPRVVDIPRGQAELTADALVAEWNMRVRHPLVAVSDSQTSRGRILTAVRQRPSIDEWRDVLDRTFASDFLMGRVAGRDGGAFRLTFWWLLEDNHADKVLAGAYDNRGKVADAEAAKSRSAVDAEKRKSAAILAGLRPPAGAH